MSPRDLWGSFQPTVLNCVLKCAQREVLEASLSQATTIISREEHLEVVGVCSKAVVTDPVCSYSKLFQVPVTCAQLFVCQSYLQSGLKKENPNRWDPGLEGLGGPFLGERRGKDLTRPVRSSHLGFGKHCCSLGAERAGLEHA